MAEPVNIEIDDTGKDVRVTVNGRMAALFDCFTLGADQACKDATDYADVIKQRNRPAAEPHPQT